MFHGLSMACIAAILAAAPVYAQSSRISEDRGSFEFSSNGQSISITRNGVSCPPACIQPMQAVSSVGTIGELELLDFLQLFVSSGKGLLVDTRLPAGFAAGTIPGSVNIPAATLQNDNPYRDDLLNALGVRGNDFSNAFDLVLYDDSPAANGAPNALRDLIAAGYPADKLKYYRGGFLVWQTLGLTVASGQ